MCELRDFKPDDPLPVDPRTGLIYGARNKKDQERIRRFGESRRSLLNNDVPEPHVAATRKTAEWLTTLKRDKAFYENALKCLQQDVAKHQELIERHRREIAAIEDDGA